MSEFKLPLQKVWV